METIIHEKLFSDIIYEIHIISLYFNRYNFENKNLNIIEIDMRNACIQLKHCMRALILDIDHKQIEVFEIIEAIETVFSLLQSLSNLNDKFTKTLNYDHLLVLRVSNVIVRYIEIYESYYIMLKKKCKYYLK